jgi:hypothetical protein
MGARVATSSLERAALEMLVRTLASSSTEGTSLLLGGMQVWLINVVGFGLLFWEIDRGGPVARHTLARERLPSADWRFSQDENQDTVREVAASSRSEQLEAGLHRLPLRLAHQLECF